MQRSDPATEGPEGAPSQALPLSRQRERNATVTRQRLLEAAEREFAARGFAGARLRAIAQSAGVQPALIHHYFADKQGLYRAVLDRALLPTSTESWSLLGSCQDLEGLFTGFVDLLLRFYTAHPNLLAILRHEALRGSTVFTEVCRERTVPVIEAVKLLLEEKQRAGEVRADVPATEIITAALSMAIYPFADAGICEVMMPSAIVRDEASLERRKRAIVTLLLGGLRAAR
jgi:TetR/AcrR family transcriptional regulator